MQNAELSVVTGAYGYTGRHIARRLLSLGRAVRTLTGHPDRTSPFGGQVEAFPFNFDRPDDLARSLEGATTLYNTYWVRFPRGRVTYDSAVAHTETLIRAAEAAGVRRIVHISITNASEHSSLPYFRGKGLLERAIARSKLSYAILRPTVIFGDEDVLINNIAWFLRRFPLFPVGGSGACRIQPVHVEDVAEMAVRAAGESTNVVLDAAGPETYTYIDMVQLIARAVLSRAKVVHVPAGLNLLLARLAGYLVRDVVLTRDESEGLMAGLLVADGAPTGHTLLSKWLEAHSESVGARYASELKRHYRNRS